MKVYKPEILKSLSSEMLKQQAKACGKLLAGYESGEGLPSCPLCEVIEYLKHGCAKCPWNYMRNLRYQPFPVPCSRAIKADISDVRESPKDYKRQANNRIHQLKVWIEVIQGEIDSRD